MMVSFNTERTGKEAAESYLTVLSQEPTGDEKNHKSG